MKLQKHIKQSLKKELDGYTHQIHDNDACENGKGTNLTGKQNKDDFNCIYNALFILKYQKQK